MESFSADYGQARMKFVEATKAQGGALECIAHPARCRTAPLSRWILRGLAIGQPARCSWHSPASTGSKAFLVRGCRSNGSTAARTGGYRGTPQRSWSTRSTLTASRGCGVRTRTTSTSIAIGSISIAPCRPTSDTRKSRRIFVHPMGRPTRRRWPTPAWQAGASITDRSGPPRPGNRTCPGFRPLLRRYASRDSRVCSVNSNRTGRPVFLWRTFGAVDCVALRRCVIDAQCHEIASAQFAVDRQVEEG
jgi:hypothetical protein